MSREHAWELGSILCSSTRGKAGVLGGQAHVHVREPIGRGRRLWAREGERCHRVQQCSGSGIFFTEGCRVVDGVSRLLGWGAERAGQGIWMGL
jgi:hypothetical protein